MKTKTILALALLLGFSTGCKSQLAKTKTDTTIDACIIKDNIENYLSEINKNAKSIISKGKDECVLALLDTLALRYISETNEEYLKSLERICEVSDGYVSEYLWTIGQKLFYNNFNGYFKYIYTRQEQKNSCLKELLIKSISVELNEAKDKQTKKKNIEDYINRQIVENKLSQKEIDFLRSIEKKFNGKILD